MAKSGVRGERRANVGGAGSRGALVRVGTGRLVDCLVFVFFSRVFGVPWDTGGGGGAAAAVTAVLVGVPILSSGCSRCQKHSKSQLFLPRPPLARP